MARVKSARRYDSTLRRQQAVQTRARILDAAELLFADRGFGATTMEAIASEAGVATDTVYAGFRSKPGVLHALIDVRIGGDEAPVALIDRPGPQAVQVERSQKRQIAGIAAGVAEVLERARPVDDIMRGAAAVDPEVAALRARIQAARHDNMRRFASWVAASGPLRGGMDLDEAAAVLWTLTSPEVHRLLITERGWSSARYRTWLAGTLTRVLLP
jgi:AcrR family transcriptional regulator